MTTLTKKKILDDLKDKEARDIFVEEHVSTGVPFQIHALREKLGLTQTELARRAGMAQERISKLEDPNYEFIPKINTLLKLASVFDVPLIVRFGSWWELFEWETDLSPEKLAPPTFDEELETLEARVSSTDTTFYVRTIAVDKFTVGSVGQGVLSFAPMRFPPSALRFTNSLDWLAWRRANAFRLNEQVEEEFPETLPPPATLIDYTSGRPF